MATFQYRVSCKHVKTNKKMFQCFSDLMMSLSRNGNKLMQVQLFLFQLVDNDIFNVVAEMSTHYFGSLYMLMFLQIIINKSKLYGV